MFNEIKKKLYFTKFNKLFNKAFERGKITKFDDRIFEKMNDTIISCLPVSFHIKYSKNLFFMGSCFDISLYMFLALEDAILVKGDNIDLEYTYGKGHAEHEWIEIGDYVYDPSLMLKYEKDTYYSLYGCSNIHKIDKKTYLKQNKDFVDLQVSHDFNEFRPGGKRRLELKIIIMEIKALSELLGDEKFNKEFNAWLSLIEYDEKQIEEEIFNINESTVDVKHLSLI